MRTLVIAILFFLCLGPSAVANPVQPQSSDERAEDAAAIRQHIDSIFGAYIAKDRAKIRSTHSEDWRGFLRPSTSVIKGIDAYMRAAEAALSGPYGLKGYTFVEYDTVFYGDTAVVNYIAEIDPGRRLPIRPMIRVLDVYVDMDGHWIQVASQTAQHPDTLAARREQSAPVTEQLRDQILDAREQVWRAWFANRADLGEMLPAELIAINARESTWKNRDEILKSAAGFAGQGGELTRLEFPRTEIQLIGAVAILYTTYLFEFRIEGETTELAGRGTEIFVHRDGRWVNSGWHLDDGVDGE